MATTNLSTSHLVLLALIIECLHYGNAFLIATQASIGIFPIEYETLVHDMIDVTAHIFLRLLQCMLAYDVSASRITSVVLLNFLALQLSAEATMTWALPVGGYYLLADGSFAKSAPFLSIFLDFYPRRTPGHSYEEVLLKRMWVVLLRICVYVFLEAVAGAGIVELGKERAREKRGDGSEPGRKIEGKDGVVRKDEEPRSAGTVRQRVTKKTPAPVCSSSAPQGKLQPHKRSAFLAYHFFYLVLANYYLESKDLRFFHLSHCMNFARAVLFGWW